MTYSNPFYSPKIHGSTREITCDSSPVEYRGYLIFQRIQGQVWDVVKDGVCLTMMAGPNGARRAIDGLINEL
jgi:hypothetical protein